MALSDLYIATVRAIHRTEFPNTTFSFQGLTSTASASDLATRINNQYFPDWSDDLSNQVQFVDVVVRNLFDPNDVFLLPIVHAGVIIGDDLPSYVAMTVKLSHNRPSVNPGSKRLFGFVESHQLGGVWQQTILDNIQATVDNIFTQPLIGAGGVDAYDPVVIGRIAEEQPDGSIKYRLPINLSEANFGVISAGVIDTFCSTQTSRKAQS